MHLPTGPPKADTQAPTHLCELDDWGEGRETRILGVANGKTKRKMMEKGFDLPMLLGYGGQLAMEKGL